MMALAFKERVTAAQVQEKPVGSSVVVAGWAALVKSLGKVAFVKLRDRSGTVQLTAHPGFEGFSEIEKIPAESVIIARGKVQESKLKTADKELALEEFRVVTRSEPVPIDLSGKIPTRLDKRLDHRIIDLRKPEVLSVFKIRSTANHSIREFLVKEGFLEIQTPKIISAGAEGGATLFPVVYYGKKAFLSQSQQLYKQMLLGAGFEKVFEIGPTFRAEKSHTTRHLAEFTHFDFEMSFIDDEDDVLKVLERLFVHVLKEVKNKCKDELKLLNSKIEVPKLPFPRITYEETIKMLQDDGSKIKLGDDVGTEDEKRLGVLVKKKHKSDAYFHTKWPFALKPFYIMKENELSRGFDFHYKGLELASGGQREHRHEELVKNIKAKGLKPENFEFYLSAFKYGMPPHGGFGMGIDRLTQMLCNLDNIREAVLFPRDPERLSP